MSLIRRKTKPETITTRAVAERWGRSTKHVVRLLKANDVQRTQLVDMPNAAFEWSLRDVLDVERRIFGGLR